MLAFFSLLLFSNCDQNEMVSEMVIGTITGPNQTKCPAPCWGGWFIEIEGGTYHFSKIPIDSELNASSIENYPIQVQLRYDLIDDCSNNTIEIIEIEVI